MQQRKVIHVQLLGATHRNTDREHTYFGSLTAVFLFHDAEEDLEVSKSTLDRHDFEAGPFDNSRCIIRLGTLHTPGALRKELQ